MAIFQLPEANALEVATRVRATMDRLSKAFPPGLVHGVPFDTTTFVRASINEVYRTLFIAAVLVLIVIMVFVQDWRAILVPATTVPVTIIGAFAAMAALGFSVNLATLFAIVLAIGIVVDDAIVVVEGAARHIEQGLTPKEAAIKAMAELFGPIVGITLVLMSVFLPAAFLPGVSGQLYRQFALVMAATALLSAINAATLKPTQCALWLRRAPQQRNIFFRGFNRVYAAAERAYAGLVARTVRHSLIMAAFGMGLGALAIWGLAALPTSFIPIEDQGYVIAGVQLPEGASLERTEQVMDRIADHRARHARRRARGGDRRHLGARQQRLARQRRSHLRGPQGLERAGQGRGTAEPLREAQRRAVEAGGRRRIRPRAAVDPRRRQCRRIPDGDRAAGQQLRLPEAAERGPGRGSKKAARSPESSGP